MQRASDPSSGRTEPATSDVAAALRDLAFAVRALQLYPASSPVVVGAVERAHAGLAPFVQGGRLSIAVLPDSLRVGSQGSAGPAPTDSLMSTLAERLHQRGVAHLHLDGSLQPSGVAHLAEILATDVDSLTAQGGIKQELEQRRVDGIDLDLLQLDRLFQGDSGDAETATAVWELLLADYRGGAGRADADLAHLVGDDARLDDFLGWLLSDSSPAPEVADMSRVELLRTVCEGLGSAAAALGPDRIEAVAEVLGRHYGDLDKEVWIDLLSPPAAGAAETLPGNPLTPSPNAPSAPLCDLTRAIGASWGRDQVADLLAYALTSREKASPRMLGLFHDLLEARSEHDLMEQAIREAVERQTSPDANRGNFERLWPQISDALQDEHMDEFVSTSYRAQLEHLLAHPAATKLWDLDRITPRFRELNSTYLVRRKAKVILEVLDTPNDDDAYVRLVEELERSLPELVFDGQYIAAEEVLEALAADLIPTSGLSEVQREAARSILIRFCNQHTLREVVRNLAGRPITQIEAAARIFAALGPMAVPALLEALAEEQSRPVRVHLVRMLASMGDQALPEIRKHLRDKRPSFVRSLLRVIGEIGDPRFVPHLGVIVNHADVRVRLEAVRSIAKLRDEAATKLLLSAARDSSPEVRLLAIRALGNSGTASAIQPLIELIRLPNRTGKNTELVRTAAVALARLGAHEAVDDLVTLARRPWLFRGRRIAAAEAASWAIETLRGEAANEAPETPWDVVRAGPGDPRPLPDRSPPDATDT